MFIEDSEEPEWLHGSDFDLVHFRQMIHAFRNLQGLLTKIYPFVPAAADVQPFRPQEKKVTNHWRIDMSRTVAGWNSTNSSLKSGATMDL